MLIFIHVAYNQAGTQGIGLRDIPVDVRLDG